MSHYQLKTAIQIDASADKIWKILNDFNNYPAWNPFIKSISGEMKEGQQIKVKFADMQFKPILLRYERNKEIRWIGKLGLKGLFDGEHKFAIKDNHDGTVIFEHEEQFSGLLVSVFKNKLKTKIKSDFESMNEALKVQAETK